MENVDFDFDGVYMYNMYTHRAQTLYGLFVCARASTIYFHRRRARAMRSIMFSMLVRARSRDAALYEIASACGREAA